MSARLTPDPPAEAWKNGLVPNLDAATGIFHSGGLTSIVSAMAESIRVALTVNGSPQERDVEPRLLLSDFIRHELDLTGTHVGCEHGVCGACTILFNGEAVRSCLIFAAQADGAELTTIEGLTPAAGQALHPLQEAFHEAHGLQCGFCTPGILMTLVPFLAENPSPSEPEIREALSAHLCRCTGYAGIVKAVALAADRQGARPAS